MHEPHALSCSSLTSREILARRLPLLDVRAPIEFRAAFPTAENHPLLVDAERERVGRAYKQRGKEAAIALGHELVAGDTKSARVKAWVEFVRANDDALVCCARGGLRSEIAARWLAEAGEPRERVTGGYKSLRTEALAVIAEAASDRDWLILGGKTGCAKTTLLGELPNRLDFEAAANHRGSSFGGFATPQPSQASFENRIAVELLDHAGPGLIVEDEGRNLGTLAIPEVMVKRMRRSPVVVLEVPFDERVTNIVNDYVRDPLDAGERGEELCARYRAALERLRKRLGDERWRQLDERIEAAFAVTELDAHRVWVAGVLTHYYDPMYEYQLSKKTERVKFSGTTDEVRTYLGKLAPQVTTS